MEAEGDHPYFGKKGEVYKPPEKKKSRLSLDRLKEICLEIIPLKRDPPKDPDPLDW